MPNYINLNQQLGEKMNTIALKLVTGEDLLGEIESESETEFVIVNPVGIVTVRGKDGQPSIGFSPFPLHAEQKTGATVALSKKNVVYSYVPAEDFVSNYNQIFGSGLVVPPTPKIITG
jgi:alpha-D-ribose 1-methylphosphonate 5-triphosphate synthase subunit PhnG